MGAHWTSGGFTASATPVDKGLSQTLLPLPRIGFDVADKGLHRALRTAIAGRADALEADLEAADIVVTDLPAEPMSRAVHVGPSGIDSRNPHHILAAAILVAAGYAVSLPVTTPTENRPALSQRELQVAALLADGASNKGIARDLGISVHTAKFHVTAILEKLGARNRADAVAILLRENLLAA
jgi:DNA-binding NarL/FixJ family response regulator